LRKVCGPAQAVARRLLRVSAFRLKSRDGKPRSIGKSGTWSSEKIGFPLISQVAHVILVGTRLFREDSGETGLFG
jgi:hypothetical protein